MLHCVKILQCFFSLVKFCEFSAFSPAILGNMGGWQLEIAKMALYITFPVALFHYFNQPEYFEKWVTHMKRELYPPEDTSQNEEFRKAIRSVRVAKEKEILRALEDIERKERGNA